MSTGTGALQTTYPGQKRADKRTFNRRILLIIERSKPTNEDDRLCTSTPPYYSILLLRLNYRLISTIRYLQRLFVHKKISPARLACLCSNLVRVVFRSLSNSLNLLFGDRYIVPSIIFLDLSLIISINKASISPVLFSGTRSSVI